MTSRVVLSLAILKFNAAVVLICLFSASAAAQEGLPPAVDEKPGESLVEGSRRHIDGLVTLPLDRNLFATGEARLALGTLAAQPEDDIDETSLAQQSQNPVADLISLPIQMNTFFGLGEHDRTRSVTNIQPVIPINLGGVNLISRIIMPLVYRPDFAAPTGGTFGFGDTTYTAFFSPSRPSKLIWGAGPVALFPTASDENLGSEKWGLGPSGVALTIQGPWVIGALVSQIWSVGGDDDRADISAFLTQYFINYNMADGWFLTSAPIITANWKADDGNKWVVPFGGGFGKIFLIGRQPMNFNTQVFYNAVKPDIAAFGNIEWRFQLTLLFPK